MKVIVLRPKDLQSSFRDGSKKIDLDSFKESSLSQEDIAQASLVMFLTEGILIVMKTIATQDCEEIINSLMATRMYRINH